MPKQLIDASAKTDICVPQNAILRVFYNFFRKYTWLSGFKTIYANNNHTLKTDNQLNSEENSFTDLFHKDVCESEVSSSQKLETDLLNLKKFEEKLPDSNPSSSKQLRQSVSENTNINKHKNNKNKKQCLDDCFHESEKTLYSFPADCKNKMSENKEQPEDDDPHDSQNTFTRIVADVKDDKMSENKELSTDDDLHDLEKILIKSAADIKNDKMYENKEKSIDNGIHDSEKTLFKSAADIKNDKISENNKQSIDNGPNETTLINSLHETTAPVIKEKLNENKEQRAIVRLHDSGEGEHSALCKKYNSYICDIGFDSIITPTTPKLECFESNQTVISVQGNNVKNKILAWEKLSRKEISRHSEMSEFCAPRENHLKPEICNNCIKMDKSNVQKEMKQNNSISVREESLIPVVSEDKKRKVRPDFAIMNVSPRIADLQAALLQKMKEDA